MTEILTESFCERCGSRYTFESAVPKDRLRRVKVLSRGLKTFVLDDKTSFDEAIAAARSDTDREATSSQLDAFHKTFNFCMQCRQYTCPNCWNEPEGRCLTCAPISHAAAAAPFQDLAPAPGLAMPPTAANGVSGVAALDATPIAEPDGSIAPAANGHAPETTADAFDPIARLDALSTFAAPVAEPTVTEPTVEPVAEAAAESPVAEPTWPVEETIAPVVEPTAVTSVGDAVITEPAAEALATEPVLEPSAGEPVVEPLVEAAESVEESITVEPVAVEPVIEPVVEPVAVEPVAVEPLAVEPVIEPVVEPVAIEPIIEPVVEQIAVEPLDELVFEPVDDVAPTPVDVSAAAPEPVEVDLAAEPDTATAPNEAPTDERPAVAAAAAGTLFVGLRPGESLDDAIDAYEREGPKAAVEPDPVAAAPEPIIEPEPEPVAAEPAIEPEPLVVETTAAAPLVVPEPEPVAVEPEPEPVAAAPEPIIEPEPEPVAAEPEPIIEPEPEPVAAEPEHVAVEPEPEPEPVAAAPEPVAVEPEHVAATPPTPLAVDVVEQPTWTIVAPETAPSNGAPAAVPPAALPPAAEAAWPETPEWPARQASPGLPYLNRPAVPTGGVDALWAASDREVTTAPVGDRPVAGVQSCVSCGLSLSATARFCRRCGTAQH